MPQSEVYSVSKAAESVRAQPPVASTRVRLANDLNVTRVKSRREREREADGELVDVAGSQGSVLGSEAGTRVVPHGL